MSEDRTEIAEPVIGVDKWDPDKQEWFSHDEMFFGPEDWAEGRAAVEWNAWAVGELDVAAHEDEWPPGTYSYCVETQDECGRQVTMLGSGEWEWEPGR